MSECPRCRRLLVGVLICTYCTSLLASDRVGIRDCRAELCDAVIAAKIDDDHAREGGSEAPVTSASAAVSGVPTMRPFGWNMTQDLPPLKPRVNLTAMMDPSPNAGWLVQHLGSGV